MVYIILIIENTGLCERRISAPSGTREAGKRTGAEELRREAMGAMVMGEALQSTL